MIRQFAEQDPETGLNGFELRLYDSRINRWTTTDPYNQHYSPYLAMGNNWISRIDPDGGQNIRVYGDGCSVAATNFGCLTSNGSDPYAGSGMIQTDAMQSVNEQFAQWDANVAYNNSAAYVQSYFESQGVDYGQVQQDGGYFSYNGELNDYSEQGNNFTFGEVGYDWVSVGTGRRTGVCYECNAFLNDISSFNIPGISWPSFKQMVYIQGWSTFNNKNFKGEDTTGMERLGTIDNETHIPFIGQANLRTLSGNKGKILDLYDKGNEASDHFAPIFDFIISEAMTSDKVVDTVYRYELIRNNKAINVDTLNNNLRDAGKHTRMRNSDMHLQPKADTTYITPIIIYETN